MARKINNNKDNLVGKKIKKLRKERGWSQAQLSAKLELIPTYVCRGSISRVEDQTRSVTDFELAAFAEVFNVSVSELFEDIDDDA